MANKAKLTDGNKTEGSSKVSRGRETSGSTTSETGWDEGDWSCPPQRGE